ANQRREAAKGAAQQATREQEAALQAVSDWVGQYTRIAKVALRDKKHLLEKLGIGVRMSKTAAQRAAPQKAAATRAARKQAPPPYGVGTARASGREHDTGLYTRAELGRGTCA